MKFPETITLNDGTQAPYKKLYEIVQMVQALRKTDEGRAFLEKLISREGEIALSYGLQVNFKKIDWNSDFELICRVARNCWHPLLEGKDAWGYPAPRIKFGKTTIYQENLDVLYRMCLEVRNVQSDNMFRRLMDNEVWMTDIAMWSFIGLDGSDKDYKIMRTFLLGIRDGIYQYEGVLSVAE